MAREVKRRGGGPSYLVLTVVFVFLFVVSATLLVMVYSESENIKKECQRLQGTIDGVVDSGDEKVYAAYLAEAREKKSKGQQITTLVNHISTQRDKLMTPVVSQATTPAVVEKVVEEFYENPLRKKYNPNPASKGTLPEEAVLAYGIAEKFDEACKAEVVKNTAAQERIRALEQEQGTYAQKYKEAEAQNAKAITELDEKTKKQFEDYQAELKKAKDENTKVIEQLESKSAELLAKLTEDERRIADQQKVITSQNLKIRELTDKVNAGPRNIQMVSVGKIIGVGANRMPDGSEICYIDRGTNDKVKNNMTFAVYSPKSLNEATPSAKAKLLVTDAKEKYSVCRIINPKQDEPIAVDDPVINLVYSPVRSSSFVVCGDLDLLQTGGLSRTADDYNRKLKQVKDFITRAGGKLSDKVEVTTDFIVLGEEPTLPPAPDASATEHARQAYNNMKKLKDDYESIKVDAARMGVPVLNAGRFIALTGFVATTE